MEIKNVFISYSRVNRDFVVQLVESLRSKGLEVWFDKQIRTGTQWDEVLEKQIRDADNLIIVLSEDSVESDYVKNEMFYAQQNDTTVNLILMEPCKLPLAMSRMHYIDFTLGYDEGVKRLAEDIKIGAGEIEKTDSIKGIQNLKSGGVKDKGGKKKRLIITSIFGVLLIAFFVYQFYPFETGIGISGDDGIPEIVVDSTWLVLSQSNSINDYTEYLNEHGDTALRFNDAVVKIKELMNDKGAVIIAREKFFDHFYKYLYKNKEGKYVMNNPDHPNIDWPQKGDILAVKYITTVMDPLTRDVKSGIRLDVGNKVEFIENKEESDTVVMVKYYFKYLKPVTSGEVVDESIAESMEDPVKVEEGVYKSTFDTSKISSRYSEEEVWKIISTDDIDPFEGCLYYLERYGMKSSYSDDAFECVMEQFDKEGFVVYEVSQPETVFFKRFICTDGSEWKIGQQEGIPLPKEIVIGLNVRPLIVYSDVHNVNENRTGDLIYSNQLVMVLEYISVEDEDRPAKSFLRVLYRDIN